ncbi:MAG: nicotinamide-nucleotide amidohydrolase family protein, partial [Synergistaceae bacterium]|nr:nicotinamide-nucleotide amidohydrolase family protein [Synergistaceae bacterium]
MVYTMGYKDIFDYVNSEEDKLDMKKVLLLAIGDELLSGIRRDTNCAGAAWLFHNAGWKIEEIEIIPDEQNVIVDTLNKWTGRVELIITSGGLGPTHDDRTRFAIAEYLKCGLEVDNAAYDIIAARYADPMRHWIEHSRPMQGLMPTAAKSIHNPTGSALGILFESRNTKVYCFPGVPTEYKSMLQQEFGNILKPSGGWTSIAIVGIAESALKDHFNEIIENQELHISILPSFGIVEFVIRGEPEAIAEAERMARSILPGDCLPNGILNLPEAILYEAERMNKKIAFAESCTGGLIGAAMTEVPGISKVFMGSCVAYDNHPKRAILGVSEDILEVCGAVSPECAAAMAIGASKIYCADYAVSVTGIAGPDGGSDSKPVGLVWFGVQSHKGTRTFQRTLNG